MASRSFSIARLRASPRFPPLRALAEVRRDLNSSASSTKEPLGVARQPPIVETHGRPNRNRAIVWGSTRIFPGAPRGSLDSSSVARASDRRSPAQRANRRAPLHFPRRAPLRADVIYEIPPGNLPTRSAAPRPTTGTHVLKYSHLGVMRVIDRPCPPRPNPCVFHGENSRGPLRPAILIPSFICYSVNCAT